MLQIKRRKDGNKKYRFMATICFYQDSNHKNSLLWFKEVLGIGYLSDRNDGMSELRINGYKQVKEILKELLPFLRFKSNQAEALYKATKLLDESKDLNEKNLRQL